MAAILHGELFYGDAWRVLYNRRGGRFTPTAAEVNSLIDEFHNDKTAFMLKRFEEKLATFDLGQNVYAFIESNVKGSPVRASEFVETDYINWIDDLDFLMFAWQDEIDEDVLLQASVSKDGDFQVVVGNPFGEEVYTYRRWKDNTESYSHWKDAFGRRMNREEFNAATVPMGLEIMEHFKDYDYKI